MTAASNSEARKRAEAFLTPATFRPIAKTIAPGGGDELDVVAGRCCANCRHMLTEHNRDVWNAGYTIGVRHTRDELEAAWDAGWHEHYLERERQKADPSHAIGRRNPYTPGAQA